MDSLAKRAKKRKSLIKVTKTSLHSKNHNSFHSLDLKSSWELVAKLSLEKWIEENNTIPSNRVDKTIIKIRKLH